MSRIQEEMIKAEEIEDNGEQRLQTFDRRNLSKSTTVLPERSNNPKLLDDSHMGYGSF